MAWNGCGQHFGATDGENRGRVERTDGLIDLRLHLGMTLENLLDLPRVISFLSQLQFLYKFG